MRARGPLRQLSGLSIVDGKKTVREMPSLKLMSYCTSKWLHILPPFSYQKRKSPLKNERDRFLSIIISRFKGSEISTSVFVITDKLVSIAILFREKLPRNLFLWWEPHPQSLSQCLGTCIGHHIHQNWLQLHMTVKLISTQALGKLIPLKANC